MLSQDDKRGGNLYPNWLVEGFSQVVLDCGLTDLELKCYPYTWEKGRGTHRWVEMRLDRAMACNLWLNLFKEA